MTSIESTFGIGRLIAKHLTDALDAGEQNQLDAWLKEDERHTAIFNRIVAHESLAAALDEMQQVNTELALANVKSRISRLTERKPVRLWPKIAVAAAAVAAITLGVWVYYANEIASSRKAPRNDEQVRMNDIAPGRNGATITLANGKVIQLSDAKPGVVIGGDDLKYSDGTAVSSSLREGTTKQSPLHDESRLKSGDVMQMTASTAKGQTYQFTLPDGTKVWLNADSKISFPSRFPGEERKILLSGEAYFEVSKVVVPLSTEPMPGRASKPAKLFRVPFLVESKGQTVEVLGTHFNISAYQDERLTTTTLVEGSVRVSAFDVAVGRRIKVLKPNQQSIQTPNGGMQVRNVDVSEALDWKNGDFVFKEEPLAVIMRRVSRWYDVDVVYDKDVDQQQTFGGKVSRKRNISQVIKALQATQALKFRIEDRKVYVTN
ncbi:MAG TPA: FecR domain-containing protein [Pedobacter sp.]|uniref:FecR family protein n=1 Tax=Pedobacter sp. TaxID=1411316 RepID=UPI002CC5AE26|nr:FecR domain-containing protein [Pedobacter sp.]HMI02381.1 FecR domain-containing protein [Pedobacter sp.]